MSASTTTRCTGWVRRRSSMWAYSRVHRDRAFGVRQQSSRRLASRSRSLSLGQHRGIDLPTPIFSLPSPAAVESSTSASARRRRVWSRVTCSRRALAPGFRHHRPRRPHHAGGRCREVPAVLLRQPRSASGLRCAAAAGAADFRLARAARASAAVFSSLRSPAAATRIASSCRTALTLPTATA